MEEMHIDEFNEMCEKTPKELIFSFVCEKCKSNNVTFESYDDLGMGSEYTGMYGDAGFLIKCKDCGNAYKIETVTQ